MVYGADHLATTRSLHQKFSFDGKNCATAAMWCGSKQQPSYDELHMITMTPTVAYHKKTIATGCKYNEQQAKELRRYVVPRDLKVRNKTDQQQQPSQDTEIAEESRMSGASVAARRVRCSHMLCGSVGARVDSISLRGCRDSQRSMLALAMR